MPIPFCCCEWRWALNSDRYYTADPIASRLGNTDFLDFSIDPDQRLLDALLFVFFLFKLKQGTIEFTCRAWSVVIFPIYIYIYMYIYIWYVHIYIRPYSRDDSGFEPWPESMWIYTACSDRQESMEDVSEQGLEFLSASTPRFWVNWICMRCVFFVLFGLWFLENFHEFWGTPPTKNCFSWGVPQVGQHWILSLQRCCRLCRDETILWGGGRTRLFP